MYNLECMWMKWQNTIYNIKQSFCECVYFMVLKSWKYTYWLWQTLNCNSQSATLYIFIAKCIFIIYIIDFIFA